MTKDTISHNPHCLCTICKGKRKEEQERRNKEAIHRDWLMRDDIPKLEYAERKRYTGGDIQGEVFHRCRQKGMRCYLEYQTIVGRIDILVVREDHTTVCIVETKGEWDLENGLEESVYQATRYACLGIPTYLITNPDQIDRLMNFIESDYNNPPKTPKKGKFEVVELH